MKFGLYRLQEVLDESGLSMVERKCGVAVDVISVYRAWNECRIEDDTVWLDRLKGGSRDVLLTWEPWRLPEDGEAASRDQPGFSLKQLLSGRYDSYILAFARALSEFSQTVYLRLMHEMNGNWYPWCGSVNQNRTELFVPAWNHISNLVRCQSSSNISLVWSPYAASYPGGAGNALSDYFPGDSTVDWVALDGYNWGTAQPEIGWQSFENIFQDAYQSITKISRRPLMIAETGCSESGGDKARWIREAFDALENGFDRVEMLVWFDVKKECDWRIASSRSSLEAFKAAMHLFQAAGKKHGALV